MLKQMRENTKPVLWIVLVGFLGGFVLIALGTGSGGFADLVRSLGIKVGGSSRYVGVVNGIPITPEQFQREYSNQRETERERLGDSYVDDERTLNQIRNKTWDSLVQRLLVHSEAQKLGITVSSRELAEFLVSNPPQWMMEHPQLQTDGQFDMQKYLQVLQSPGGPSAGLQATYAELLPLHKLERRVLMSSRVTSLEKERELNSTIERVGADCIAVKEFHFTKPTDSDTERVRSLAEELSKKIKNAEDFHKYAKELSFGSNAPTGGKMGRLDKGNRGAAMDSVLFSLTPNSCSSPMEQYGSWYLFFVHERGEDDGGEWVDYSQIVLNVTPPVDEKELKEYFKEHKEEYSVPAKAKTKFIRVEKAATEDDENEILEDIVAIREDIMNGMSFEETAKLESEDEGSAERGGDLGTFGRGRMVKEFEDIAFSIEPGEISQPVRTQFGYHVIRVDERSKDDSGEDQVSARHILLKIEPTRATLDSLYEFSIDLAENARSNGLEAAATDAGLEVSETDLFAKGSYIPGIGSSSRGASWIFNRAVGTISDPIETDDAFFILQSTEKQEPRDATIAEVRGRLVRAFLRDKASERAREYVGEVIVKLRNGATLQEVSEADSLVELLEDVQFGRTEYAAGIGRSVEAIGVPFGIENGQMAGPTSASQAFIVVHRDSSWVIDSSIPQEEMVARLDESARQRTYSSWFSWLQEKAEIEDNRERFYGIQ